MTESSTEGLVDQLSVGEDRLRRYHTTYYSFLIPYTGAGGAVVWTIVSNDTSLFIHLAAAMFVISLSLFYFVWLRSCYHRMARTLRDTRRIWEQLMPDAPNDPYAADSNDPEQVFLWFVLAMGFAGAAVCVLDSFWAPL